MEDISLQDIFRILFRWKKRFLVTFFVLFAIAMVIALRWSNYRSTATVQIELSTIAQNIVNNPNENVVTLADQRINQIQQKVTSLESLAQIIKKFNLYPEISESVPVAALTDMMRSKINMTLISGTIANPAAAQKQTAEQLSAIGFTLSFDYKNPQLAQQVTDELVTRFLDEDLKMRHSQTKETSEFIATQIENIEKGFVEQEKAIADFRSKHGESGPAALLFNQQASANIAISIQSIDAQITANEGLQGSLRAQLATVPPYARIAADGQTITTPETQLKALETELATLKGQYGEQHPDVIKMRKQITALRTQTSDKSPTISGELQKQIDNVNTNLIAARNTLGKTHPDVLVLEKQLKKLKEQLAKAPKSGKIKTAIKGDADNPAYVQLATQLMSAQEQHKSLIAQREELISQRTKYEKAVAENPAIEKELSKLTRDYENAQVRFRELKEKKMAADLNEQLELSRKGQRLVITSPPEVPGDTQPKRLLFILGGFILSVLGGLGVVIVTEFMTQTVYGAKHLTSLVGVMPLVVIPHIYSESQRNLPAHLKFLRQNFPEILKFIAFCKRLFGYRQYQRT
jgi:polysaccharide biosynthesis transport protein